MEEMMGQRGFIPANANAFSHFAQNLLRVVSDRTGYLIVSPPIGGTESPPAVDEKNIKRPGSDQWVHVPFEAFLALQEAVDAFEREYQNTPDGASRGQIVARNEAQKKAESQIRYFVRFYLRNPVVPDRDLVDMNIPVLDTIRTPHTEVTAQVDLTFRPSYANQIVLAFKVVGAANRARPANTIGMFVAWAFGEEEPKSLDDYTHTTLATRSPHHIEFDTHCSGKRVWFRACWQNARGIRGPWCDAQSIFVP